MAASILKKLKCDGHTTQHITEMEDLLTDEGKMVQLAKQRSIVINDWKTTFYEIFKFEIGKDSNICEHTPCEIICEDDCM